jgi:hypothetical protein
VNDFANILSANDRAALGRKLLQQALLSSWRQCRALMETP